MRPKTTCAPTTETLAFLELFANQAAVVIEGTQLYEESRRSSEERAALVEIGRALSAPEALRDLQTVYQTIYEQVKRVMPADAFFVTRYSKEPEGLFMDYFIDEEILYPPVDYGEFGSQMRQFLYENNSGMMFSAAEEYDCLSEKWKQKRLSREMMMMCSAMGVPRSRCSLFPFVMEKSLSECFRRRATSPTRIHSATWRCCGRLACRLL